MSGSENSLTMLAFIRTQ